MSQDNIPAQPDGSYRVVLTMNHRQPRLDTILLEALRAQGECDALKRITRTAYKTLFNEKKITIKGQAAKPSSGLAAGITYVDILGFEKDEG